MTDEEPTRKWYRVNDKLHEAIAQLGQGRPEDLEQLCFFTKAELLFLCEAIERAL